MTPEQLRKAGYQELDGMIMEFWKPLNSDRAFREAQLKRRLSVMFGNWSGLPFTVWLIIPNGQIRCKNVQTIEQLEQLYQLMRRPASGGPK